MSTLFFLALLLLSVNFEFYFLLLHELLVLLHQDHLLDHGRLFDRSELFSLLFSLSLGLNLLLAFNFDCPKPVMVLVQQPTFEELIRRLDEG